MNTKELQLHLRQTGRYSGAIDGIWGRLSDAGVLLAMTDGPDTKLADPDFETAGVRLKVQPAAIRAFWSVEAAGAGFEDGRPKILPERHRFSRNSGRLFDMTNPELSARTWDKRWYPKSQDARYDIILAWARLLSKANRPIDAAFASVSYGAPQILGEHAVTCGYASPFLFAEAMARDEVTQLRAFEKFVAAAGILPYLRTVKGTAASWQPVAARYNGPAYRENQYDERMARAFVRFGGK
jgi:hypothetical protein